MIRWCVWVLGKRREVNFHSPHIISRGLCTYLTIADVDLAEVALSCVSTVKWLLPPLPYCALWKGVTVYSSHLRSGDLGSMAIYFEKWRKVWVAFLGGSSRFPPQRYSVIDFLPRWFHRRGWGMPTGRLHCQVGRQELLNIKIPWRRSYSAGTSSNLAAQVHQLAHSIPLENHLSSSFSPWK